jgi:hypothetical protein
MALSLSLLVLTTIALVCGAVILLRRGMRRQGWLMLILAVVMALNLAIWTIPTQNGTSLAAGVPSN